MDNGTDMPAVTMRRARPEEYAEILAIQREAYTLKEVPLYGGNLPPLRETPETLAREAAEGKVILVGVLGGEVVASMRAQVRPDGEVYWGRLSVSPALQGRGIGQAMVAGVEGFFPDAPSFALDCGVRSEENRHIYSKLGYVATCETIQIPDGPVCGLMRKVRMR